MNILNLRRTPGAGGCLARFDVEVVPGLCLQSWELRRGPSGAWRTFCPTLRGGERSVASNTLVHDTITAAAAAAYGGQAPNARK